jgi:hypothetical protein
MSSKCSQSCECENKAENWRCCSECETAVCDFNDVPLDWTYDDEAEAWLCASCSPVCSKCESSGDLKKHTVGCLTVLLCEECTPAK